MASPRERIVVVGAGDCGTRTALGLRNRGFEGPLVLVGDEPSDPYERPALSKRVLTGETNEAKTIATADELAASAIDWQPGVAAVEVDPDNRRVTLADGSAVDYDRLLLSTGSRARRPPIAGGEHAVSVRSIRDAALLRQQLEDSERMIIIGGGFIGLEVAACAREAGCEVTVVEFAHELMARVVPAPVARVMCDRHLAAGVDLRLGTGVTSWSRDSGTGMHRVGLDDGTGLEAELLVGGVGAVPNTELAASAGLLIDNGIAVNEHLRTSDSAIWAAGDCCSVPHPLYGGRRLRLEAWGNALAQSEVAAENLLGGSAVFIAVPSFWSDQYELTMQVVGLHGAARRHVVRRRRDGHEVHIGLDDDGRVVSASGAAPGTTLARDILIAERLIARRASPAAADLADPDVDLRRLV